MIRPFTLFTLLIALLIGLRATIPVKIVIVSMFEIGEDPGDVQGEFHLWIERNVVERIAAPTGWRDYDLRQDGLLIICTAGGVTNAATSLTDQSNPPLFVACPLVYSPELAERANTPNV